MLLGVGSALSGLAAYKLATKKREDDESEHETSNPDS
jgi:hypothetical protein